MDLKQFTDFTRRRLQMYAIRGLPLYSESAVMLTMGTAAHESGLGTFLHQIGGGPALGPYGIEPATFEWIRGKYQDTFSRLLDASAPQLEWDMDLGLLVCRLRYYVAEPPLSVPDDVRGMANYWFRFYNGSGVASRRDQFILDWKRFGLPWRKYEDSVIALG